MSFLVHARPRGGPIPILEPFSADSADTDEELRKWWRFAQEVVRRGLDREAKSCELWDEYDIVLVAKEPLVAVCRNNHLLRVIRRAVAHSWGARVFVAVGELPPFSPPVDVIAPSPMANAIAAGKWISLAQLEGAHGIVGLPLGPEARDPRAIEVGLERAHDRIHALHDMLAHAGSWRASARLDGLRRGLYESLMVDRLPSTHEEGGPLAVVEHDTGLCRQVGRDLDVRCNWDVEAFEFVSRLLRRIGPPVLASPASLLLTAGFGPHESNCVHAAGEMAKLSALVPAGACTVCPALTQGRIGYVMARHPSTRAWVHASHGRGPTLSCAEGGDLSADDLLAAVKLAADMELVVLSACDSVDLAAELAQSVRYVVAYPGALRPEAAYHLSGPVVTAYFSQRGSPDAIRSAYFQGRQAQVETGHHAEPVLFIDGKRHQP